MKYSNYLRNHVILPGREQALDEFLNASIMQNGKTVKHKLQYANNSNSEDALTWSYFDVLRNLPHDRKIKALDEIMEDAFGEELHFRKFSFTDERNIDIHIGKRYAIKDSSTGESTEVDASIETDEKLIFIEAKLYNPISMPKDQQPYNQIVKKLRVGIHEAASRSSDSDPLDFYFILLDIAPPEYLLKYGYKAITAEIFTDYKTNPDFLYDDLVDTPYCCTLSDVVRNMGWLTWASLSKTVLRAVIIK
jgi:hypothetical protein